MMTFEDHLEAAKEHRRQAGMKALFCLHALARAVMTQHPELHEFVSGMGTCYFKDKDDNIVYPPENDPKTKPVRDFLDKWDEELKLTGVPARFTATGEWRTEW